MKLTKYIAILLFLYTYIAKAQVDKRTVEVENLYKDEKYNAVIKYKRHRIKSLPAKVLYYKGMSYMQQEDSDNALMMFDKAIEKGPIDMDMYFQKSIVHSGKKQYRKAISSINNALAFDAENANLQALKGELYFYKEDNDSALISLLKAVSIEGCDPKAFLLVGEIYKEKKAYSEAFDYYKKAFFMVKPQGDYHNYCSYNMGSMQKRMNKFEEAKKCFQTHYNIYPKDYSGISQLIQLNSALSSYDENVILKQILYEAHTDKKLAKEMKNAFCFESFEWQGNSVFGWEFFNPLNDKANYTKFKYVMLDEKDNIVLKIIAELDSLKKDSILSLKMIRKDTCYSYNNLKFGYSPNFKQLSLTVKEILDNKHSPNDTIASYGVWSDQIRVKRTSLPNKGRDGSSYEKAIIVESISQEYEWLREFYPGHSTRGQSLNFHENKPYDILHIETIDGVKKDVFFDIGSFFGKGF